jgi:chromosome partitioning protein
MDPQAALTASFKIDPGDENNAYTFLTSKKILRDCIRKTEIENLFILPSVLDLAGAEAELLGRIGFERTLQKLLQKENSYDYVIIDSPPSLGVLAANCIVAAHHLVIPVQCEFLALKALAQLNGIIENAKTSNPDITKKILFTMYNKRTVHAEEVVSEIRKFFKTYKTCVTRTIKFAESVAAGIPLVLLYEDSEQAEQYRQLAREVLDGKNVY